MHRPFWITLIAAIFLVIGIYWFSMGAVLLILPRSIPVVRHFPLLQNLKVAVPHFAVLIGFAWCCIGWGLLELKNWARITASAVLGLGVFWELPRILAHRVHSNWGELGMILEVVLRSVAALYLLSSSVVYVFEQSRNKITSAQ